MPPASRNSLAVGCSIPATSHIVELNSSGNLHSLSKASRVRFLHTVDMDKNGGPNNLKAWREHRGMTQEELAAKVVPATTATMISMLETGDRGLSAKWLRRLGDALKISAGHLLDHDPNDIPTDMLEIWMSADATQQRQIAEVACATGYNSRDRDRTISPAALSGS